MLETGVSYLKILTFLLHFSLLLSSFFTVTKIVVAQALTIKILLFSCFKDGNKDNSL